MKVKAIIERGKDGFYSVYMDNEGFKFGINGQGDSAEEAIKDFLIARDEMKQLFLDENMNFPDLEFEYIYDVSSFLDYYSGILSKSGLEKITGINQKQLWHYAKGIRVPKKETVHKIQDNLHRFAKELSQVKFID